MLQQALCLSSLALPYFCFTTFCMRDPKNLANSMELSFWCSFNLKIFYHSLAATCHLQLVIQVIGTRYTNFGGHGESVNISVVPPLI